MHFHLRLKFKPDEKELTPVSFFFLILSDIFILWLLCAGLSEQIRQLTDDGSYFPYKYRNMLIEKTWVENNIVRNLCDDILDRSRSTYDSERKRMHPDCQQIEDALESMSHTKSISDAFESYERLRNNYSSLEDEKKNTPEAQELYAQIAQKEQSLKDIPEVSSLIQTIFEFQKREYTGAIRSFRKFFPVKRLFLDIAFLIPLILMLAFWNRTSYKKNWHICLQISSHYVMLPFIPILFEVFRLLLEILPEELLKNLYDWLMDAKLISLWYYLAIIVSIAFIIFLIWLFQTKLFTKEKFFVKRYSAGRCMNCNSRIDYHRKFCPICGYAIKMQCPECGEETVRNIPFCASCGKEISKKNPAE